MPSAELLRLLERRSSWRKRAGVSLLVAIGAVVGIAIAAALEPDALAYLRARLTRFAAPSAAREFVAAPVAAAPALAPQVRSRPGNGEDRPDGDAVAEEAAQPRIPEMRSRKVAEWLGELASSAGRGLILAPDVVGEVTARFDDSTSWEERLAALARVHGFQYSVGDRLIEAWVRPRRDDFAPANGGDENGWADRHGGGDSDHAGANHGPESAPAADPPPTALVVRPAYARAADLVAAVAKAARAAHVEAAADTNSNSVVVAGAEEAVARVAELVRELDLPRRRFVLEAEIVELSTTARQALGVRWALEGGTVGARVDFPAADDPNEGAGIVIATDGSTTLRARISALAADGHVRVVSRPRVVVLEGRPASIESVRILRVRLPSSAVVGEIDDSAVSAGRAFEEIPVGVMLKVEPSMQGDGRIVLRIRAKSSTLGPPQPPDDIPEELSRMVDAEVAVADGETAVLGGLLRQGSNRSASGVPRLRRLPAIGFLFGKREHQDEDEELVVFVTPRLLRS
jgi:type II secretory pathway component GspD/PulD (secretin)